MWITRWAHSQRQVVFFLVKIGVILLFRRRWPFHIAPYICSGFRGCNISLGARALVETSLVLVVWLLYRINVVAWCSWWCSGQCVMPGEVSEVAASHLVKTDWVTPLTHSLRASHIEHRGCFQLPPFIIWPLLGEVTYYTVHVVTSKCSLTTPCLLLTMDSKEKCKRLVE